MVKELLIGKTAKEKVVIKAQEIARVKSVPKTLKGEYQIEILDIKTIKGGVEILVRAWDKNNLQIGFGKDGTVEIERVRLMLGADGVNGDLSYLVVPDPVGDIEVQYTKEDGIVFTQKYREDLKENLLIRVSRVISVIRKHGNENIIPGKVGNTSTAFNPVAGANSPIDGYASRLGVDEAFATIRAGAGNNSNETGTESNATIIRTSTTNNQFQTVRRGIYHFNINGALGTDGIDSSNLLFYVFSTFKNELSQSIGVVQGAPSNNADIVDADFQDAFTLNSPTEYATRKAMSSFVGNQYESWAINAAGLAFIDTNRAGLVKFGTRMSGDIDNSAPAWASDDESTFDIGMADHADSNVWPELVVEHSPVTNIKKVAGVAYASIKKIAGVAIASVKKIAGV